MPRLLHRQIRQAQSIDPLLPLLLRSCRDLQSARNELRWLWEHFSALGAPKRPEPSRRTRSLHQSCIERSKGKPLQYIIGDQPFGDLEIVCRPGVLIPRPETEAWTTHLAHRVLSEPFPKPRAPNTPLRILDLCTGTGCISLLMHALLHPSHPSLEILGIDISHNALDLACHNLSHNVGKALLPASATSQIRFTTGDVLQRHGICANKEWDIVLSNPPYISPDGFDRTTTRSVRNWEPKMALVPLASQKTTSALVGARMMDDEEGDVFYPSILRIALEAKAKMVVMEVGDMAQAERVAEMLLTRQGWKRCEIWKDTITKGSGELEMKELAGQKVAVKGEGNGRVVFAWRD